MIIKDSIDPIHSWRRILLEEDLGDTLEYVRSEEMQYELAKKLCIPFNIKQLSKTFRRNPSDSLLCLSTMDGEDPKVETAISVVGYPGIVAFERINSLEDLIFELKTMTFLISYFFIARINISCLNKFIAVVFLSFSSCINLKNLLFFINSRISLSWIA